MGHTAIIQFPCNFGKTVLIVNKQFLYLFYFMGLGILFNCGPFYFGKKIGKICVIVIEFFTQEIGKVYFKLSFTVMVVYLCMLSVI